ncbi:MAG TPA: hypothetical protein VM287_07555 [Egibacteraceae bacterium]|nr:hypothetical protein [Egibacteraceae bacterium]
MPAEDPNDMNDESTSSRPNPDDESSANVQTEPADEEKSAIRRKIEGSQPS